jgi:hypothetical protein
MTVVPGGYAELGPVILANRSELVGGTCGMEDVANELRRRPLPIAAVGLFGDPCPEAEKRRLVGLVGESSSCLVERLRIDLDVNLLFRAAILLAADVGCPVDSSILSSASTSTDALRRAV